MERNNANGVSTGALMTGSMSKQGETPLQPIFLNQNLNLGTQQPFNRQRGDGFKASA
jgi:hypothetical protein